jgi:hypothetical protein
MLNVVLVNVIILSVVAPWKGLPLTNTLAYLANSYFTNKCIGSQVAHTAPKLCS